MVKKPRKVLARSVVPQCFESVAKKIGDYSPFQEIPQNPVLPDKWDFLLVNYPHGHGIAKLQLYARLG